MKFMFKDIDIYEILDCVDVGMWIIEYDEKSGHHKFKINDTLRRIMGLDEKLYMTDEEHYKYWYERIESEYVKDVNQVLNNMIRMFNQKGQEYTIDEVCYIWNNDKTGKRNIRCGGKVIEYKNGIYKMCGYHQDYSNILVLRDKIKEDDERILKELKNITYLKEYYQKLAYIDELTGILNRRGFYDKISDLMKNRMRRENDHLWLAIIDIDFFKKVNDTYGHLNGDRVLKFIGNLLLEFNKQYEDVFVFRYGGEEFILIVYQHDINEVKKILEVFKNRLKDTKMQLDDNTSINVTCSIGVATIKNNSAISTEDNIGNGVKQADKALYRAKNTGRDKICFSKI